MLGSSFFTLMLAWADFSPAVTLFVSVVFSSTFTVQVTVAETVAFGSTFLKVTVLLILSISVVSALVISTNVIPVGTSSVRVISPGCSPTFVAEILKVTVSPFK